MHDQATHPLPHPTGRGLHFDELRTGDAWDTESVHIAEAEIIRFATEWDPQPFHVDKQAAEESVFGKLCASGLQTLLLTYRQFMSLSLFEGTTLAGLGMDKMRLLAPVFVDDELRVRITVAELRPASMPDRGLLNLRLSTSNQSGTVVLDTLLAMLIKRRQEASCSTN